MYCIENKIALVSGGCGGLGFEFAKELLKRNAKGISLVDINEQVGADKVQLLENEFGPDKAIFVKGFVDDADSYKNAFEETIKKYGQLDIVINNAGIIDEMEWRKCIDVNLKGVIEGTNLALRNYLPKYKRPNEEGVIVNISSVVGVQTCSALPIYSATKFGITGFTRNLATAANYAQTNIRILAMCPGFTATNIYNRMRSKADPETATRVQQGFSNEMRQSQEPQVVAESLCSMIETAKHGSFWSVEKRQTYEIVFPDDEPIKNCIS